MELLLKTARGQTTYVQQVCTASVFVVDRHRFLISLIFLLIQRQVWYPGITDAVHI